MARPPVEVADIFRRYGHTYRHAHEASLSTAQRRVMSAIEVCRTAALGGHVEQCDHCDHQLICYNSCRDRHCPKCQSLARAAWIEQRHAELLDTEYFHVVFTVPEEIAAIAFQNKARVYGILFRATAETLRVIAADPQHLGAEIGFFAVLHTWGQTLLHHPICTAWSPGAGSRPMAPAGSPAGPASSCRCGCCPGYSAACSSSICRRPSTPASSAFLRRWRPCAIAKRLPSTSRRCARPTGWSTPSLPSVDPGRSWTTWAGTPTGSRSRIIGSLPSTTAT